MKTFRDSFEENYMAYEEPCNNKRGFRIQYAYVGAWYVYQLNKEEKQRCKRIFGTMCVLGTIFFALAVLQKCELNYRSFPILFSGFSLAAFLFEWYGVLKFVFSNDKITCQSFKEINMILRIVPGVNSLLLLGASVSCVFMIVRNSLYPGMAIVPLFYFFSGVCSFLITFFYRALPYEKQKNTTWNDGSKKFIRM
ncbi:MAG: hypothetical protein Q4C77_17880 [Eubacteriales bacterium]|nr:hypothetical protein [Eubacteriales bacterium]